MMDKIRDPFERAEEWDLKPGSILHKAVASLYARLPPERRNMERVHFFNRHDASNHVEGATLGVTCAACGQPCWVSPSSAVTIAEDKSAQWAKRCASVSPTH